MKRVFIDTNVFIDFLAKRPNFYEAAAKIVSLAYHKKIKLYVSALSFATGSYLLEHHYKMSPKEISDSYEVFISFCRVTTVDYEVVNSSLNSTFSDFEDAMQHFSALHEAADYIVTRNKADFTESKILVFEPEELLVHLCNQQ